MRGGSELASLEGTLAGVLGALIVLSGSGWLTLHAFASRPAVPASGAPVPEPPLHLSAEELAQFAATHQLLKPQPGESPWSACRRETQEECGLTLESGRLACVDFRPPNAKRPGGVRFLFDCGGFSNAESVERPRTTRRQARGLAIKFHGIGELLALHCPLRLPVQVLKTFEFLLRC